MEKEKQLIEDMNTVLKGVCMAIATSQPPAARARFAQALDAASGVRAISPVARSMLANLAVTVELLSEASVHG